MARTQYIQKDYRGKPGPFVRGLHRPYVIMVTLTQDENEYVKRASIERKMSITGFVRDHLFKPGWELYMKEKLRKEQPDYPPERFQKKLKVKFFKPKRGDGHAV